MKEKHQQFIQTYCDLMQKEKRTPNPVEYVSFFYDQIEWKWINGDISYADNWVSK